MILSLNLILFIPRKIPAHTFIIAHIPSLGIRKQNRQIFNRQREERTPNLQRVKASKEPWPRDPSVILIRIISMAPHYDRNI